MMEFNGILLLNLIENLYPNICIKIFQNFVIYISNKYSNKWVNLMYQIFNFLME